jgi:hypothetical protein
MNCGRAPMMVVMVIWGCIAGVFKGIWRFLACFLRHRRIAGAARDIWHLVARFPRLKPWADSYVSGSASPKYVGQSLNFIMRFFIFIHFSDQTQKLI